VVNLPRKAEHGRNYCIQRNKKNADRQQCRPHKYQRNVSGTADFFFDFPVHHQPCHDPPAARCNERKGRICGETKTEVKDDSEGYIRRERSYSTLCRTMTFPEEVNPDKAEATLKDGILEVKVAKKSPTRGRNIPIK